MITKMKKVKKNLFDLKISQKRLYKICSTNRYSLFKSQLILLFLNFCCNPF